MTDHTHTKADDGEAITVLSADATAQVGGGDLIDDLIDQVADALKKIADTVRKLPQQPLV